MTTEVAISQRSQPRFGERVRALRQEREMPSARLARLIGLDAATLTRIELGERRPPELYPFVDRMTQAFGLSPDEASALMDLALKERFPDLPAFVPPRYIAIIGPKADAGLSGIGENILEEAGGYTLSDDAPERAEVEATLRRIVGSFDERVDARISERLQGTSAPLQLSAPSNEPANLADILAQMFATPPFKLRSLTMAEDDRGGEMVAIMPNGRKLRVVVEEILA